MYVIYDNKRQEIWLCGKVAREGGKKKAENLNEERKID